ncbi:hypothetical protein ACE2AJ_12275 [Aquihabitans daechungensis]|uniref:hypothetical protein n=1 Tax=Aquihabitans daechungensis TaxID=1052257 RepID=UPI003BA106F5
MHRAKLLTLTLIGALALVGGLAGCGSSSPSAETPTTTEAKGSSGDGGGDGATSTTDAGGSESSTTVVATGGGEFCDDLAGYINDASMADIDVTDADAYEAAVKESAEDSKDLLSKAPDDLSDSVEVLVQLQEDLVDELEKVDFDFTKLPADAMSVMGSPEVEAANEDLTAYVEDTCGIELPDAPVAESPTVTTATVTPSGN